MDVKAVLKAAFFTVFIMFIYLFSIEPIYNLTVTSGSIFLIRFLASAKMASNLSSGVSRSIFCLMKLTDTLVLSLIHI